MTATKKTQSSQAEKLEAAMASGKQNVETVVKAGAEAATKGYEQAMSMTKEQVEAAFKAGSEAFRGYEAFVSSGKANIDAVMKSGAVIAKGVQEFNKVWLGLAQDSMQESVAATKALMGCKSVQEMMGVQMDLAKAGYTRIMAENRRLSDISTKLTEEAIEPITKRVNATVETFAKPLTL